ncbi:MAG: UDP-N-acetylglucosamine 2-epimerase (non-hydrolyzing) [Planctomycetes bacterium]|nr:UDP-N-acetylglucosamine 2-epimerase (non-hydrolyzing) [Planctomycetota bacterium]
MNQKPHLIFVAGARPNFMKIAPLASSAKRTGAVTFSIVHTGQHYDQKMSDLFFKELEIPEPDVNLGVGSASHARQTAAVMTAFEKVLEDRKPDWVVVVGDVNSTIACALVSVKLGVKVAHVEAGLRSFDRTMPEEINRVLTDAISDLLFVTEQSGVDNLLHEGVDRSKIHFVGNVMIDTLLSFKERASRSRILDELGLKPGAYAPITLHRPSNVDEPEPLSRILTAFESLNGLLTLLWPIHPRTRASLERFGFKERLDHIKGLQVLSPLGYIDFLKIQSEAALIITDSGGIQEEANILKVPCVTMRENTERPSTLECGGNVLVGNNTQAIIDQVRIMASLDRKNITNPPLWDGRAADRILEVLGKEQGS